MENFTPEQINQIRSLERALKKCDFSIVGMNSELYAIPEGIGTDFDSLIQNKDKIVEIKADCYMDSGGW